MESRLVFSNIKFFSVDSCLTEYNRFEFAKRVLNWMSSRNYVTQRTDNSRYDFVEIFHIHSLARSLYLTIFSLPIHITIDWYGYIYNNAFFGGFVQNIIFILLLREFFT